MTPGQPEFYRRNVGLMLIAPDRRIFVGRRIKQPDAWQMPQGGIDDGESPVEAACRELWEEVGTTRALLMRESARWLTYDVPEMLRPAHWKGRWHWLAAADLLDHIVPFKRPVYEAVLKEFGDLVK